MNPSSTSFIIPAREATPEDSANIPSLFARSLCDFNISSSLTETAVPLDSLIAVKAASPSHGYGSSSPVAIV
jgi:hypothetical protein